jgi:hypothetical protein
VSLLLRPVPRAARGAVLSGLAGTLALGTLLLGACSGGPVELARPPAADRTACSTLAARLPARLADLASVAHTPDDAYGGAWGDPPVTLTCGVGVPKGFGAASSCIDADGVDWFAPDEETNDNHADITLTTVTLSPRVALHVPGSRRGATLAAALIDLAVPLKSSLTQRTHCQ